MKLPRRLLIFATLALLAVAWTAWGAEPVAGRNYYSVQLLSAKSAAALQEPLARVAQQPHARIDKRGADFALRVGLWESRAEAEQGLEALRQAFPGANVRTVTYRSDSNVPAEKPPARTSAPPPAIAAASPPGNEPAQSQVLSVQPAEQRNLVPDPDIQAIKPVPPPGEPPRSRAQPRVRVAPAGPDRGECSAPAASCE